MVVECVCGATEEDELYAGEWRGDGEGVALLAML